MNFVECNKCGKCKNICPSYSIFLNEAFSPRGRVQLISYLKENKLTESRSLRERVFSCLLCGTCSNNCPLDVNVPYLVYEARERMHKGLSGLLFKYFSLYPGAFFSLIRTLNQIKPIINLLKKQKKLPTNFLEKFSFFPNKKFDNEAFRIFNKVRPKGRVALFLGCTTNFLFPSISEALINILISADFEVIIPKQYCCGAPLLSAGFKEDMIKLARKNIENYNYFNIDGVITPCPTCAHFLSGVYKDFTGEEIKVLKLGDLISDITFHQTLSTNYHSLSTIFHVSCHSKNYTKETESILSLLKDFDITKKDGCCGFAGLFSFLFERQSMDILEKKVLEYQKADIIISSCPNCMIQFKFAFKNRRILHYAEFISNIVKGDKDERKRP